MSEVQWEAFREHLSDYLGLEKEEIKKTTNLYEELGANQYKEFLKRYPEQMKQAKLRLADLYNRGGFTDGYWKQHNGKAMMSMERPNHSGVLVGKVEKVTGNTAQILVQENLSAQDLLEIRMANGDGYEFTLKNAVQKQERMQANFKSGLQIRPKDLVYRTKNATLLTKLEEDYLKQEKKVPIQGTLIAKEGEPCQLTLQVMAGKSMPCIPFPEEKQTLLTVTTEGFVVPSAQKQPATEEAVRRPLVKTNDTPFVFECRKTCMHEEIAERTLNSCFNDRTKSSSAQTVGTSCKKDGWSVFDEQNQTTNDGKKQALEIQLEGNVFLPNGQLNELRRTALARLEEKIKEQYVREEPVRRMSSSLQNRLVLDGEKKTHLISCENGIQKEEMERILNNSSTSSKDSSAFYKDRTNALEKKEDKEKITFVCQIEEIEQLEAVLAVKEVYSIYVNCPDCSVQMHEEMRKQIQATGKQAILVLPHIFRSSVQKKYEERWNTFAQYDGFLVRNMEELVFLYDKEQVYKEGKAIILNYNMYVMNEEAKQFYLERGMTAFTAPVELNEKEWSLLGIEDMTVLVYGRLPLMVSAQCIRKNVMECKKIDHLPEKTLFLTDRLGKQYLTRQSCTPCYNTIYNPECVSLLSERDALLRMGAKMFRFDFTFETKEEIQAILEDACFVFYYGKDTKKTGSYTKGHYKRGVQ